MINYADNHILTLAREYVTCVDAMTSGTAFMDVHNHALLSSHRTVLHDELIRLTRIEDRKAMYSWCRDLLRGPTAMGNNVFMKTDDHTCPNCHWQLDGDDTLEDLSDLRGWNALGVLKIPCRYCKAPLLIQEEEIRRGRDGWTNYYVSIDQSEQEPSS